jgi:hypothetical protein
MEKKLAFAAFLPRLPFDQMLVLTGSAISIRTDMVICGLEESVIGHAGMVELGVGLQAIEVSMEGLRTKFQVHTKQVESDYKPSGRVSRLSNKLKPISFISPLRPVDVARSHISRPPHYDVSDVYIVVGIWS